MDEKRLKNILTGITQESETTVRKTKQPAPGKPHQNFPLSPGELAEHLARIARRQKAQRAAEDRQRAQARAALIILMGAVALLCLRLAL